MPVSLSKPVSLTKTARLIDTFNVEVGMVVCAEDGSKPGIVTDLFGMSGLRVLRVVTRDATTESHLRYDSRVYIRADRAHPEQTFAACRRWYNERYCV